MAKQTQEKGGGCSGCGCLTFLLILGALGYFGYTRQAPLREQAAKYGVKIPEIRLPDVKMPVIPGVKLPWTKATPAPVTATPPPFPAASPSAPPMGSGDDVLPEPTETPALPASPSSGEIGTEVTAVLEKQIPIGKVMRLVVTVQRGDVTITADSPGTIRITATRKIDAGADREMATRWRDAAKFTVEPKEDALILRDTVPVSLPGTDAAIVPPHVTLNIEIHVPPGQQIAVTDTLGNIRAEGAFRTATLTTATGDILAEKVTVSESAVLKAGVGSLSFLGTAGVLKASTGSGDIYIGDEKTPAIVQKRMEVVTGAGNIVSEMMRAPQAQLIARSSIGNVEVRLPRNVKAQAQLSVGKGQVSSGLTLAKKPDGSLSGALNGGGSSTLRLETTTGNARLEGR